MIHELLLSPTETASGSHPCCVVSVTYHRPSFHGGNTGSNPVGDAKSFQELAKRYLNVDTKRHNSDLIPMGIALESPVFPRILSVFS